MQASTPASFMHVVFLPKISYTSMSTDFVWCRLTAHTCTGGLVCVLSALLESIATLLRLDELKRLLLDPPPIVRMLLLPKLWLLLRLAFMFILAPPTPDFLEKNKKVCLLYYSNYPGLKRRSKITSCLNFFSSLFTILLYNCDASPKMQETFRHLYHAIENTANHTPGKPWYIRGRYKSQTGSTWIADLNTKSTFSRMRHTCNSTIGAILIQISDPS